MRKAYYGDEGAQIHLRKWGWPETDDQSADSAPIPLVLLPPAPHSSLYFTTIAPILARTRPVMAVDYPGYGGSDGFSDQARPTIQNYASSLERAFQAYPSLHILGFHSGCLVGFEWAKLRQVSDSNLILIDVPCFDQKTRDKYANALPSPSPIPRQLVDLESDFDKNVAQRQQDMGEGRAYDLWVETLRSGETKNAAFQAAFTYDCETAFRACPEAINISIIATQSSLLEPSRKAATLMTNSNLIECLDINRAVMEVFALELAHKIDKILEGP